MKHFNQLLERLETAADKAAQLAALQEYFQAADPRDAAWGVYFLQGNQLPCTVGSAQLREWIAVETGLPLWLVEVSCKEAGSVSEALALMLPCVGQADCPALHELVEKHLLPLHSAPPTTWPALVQPLWARFNTNQAALLLKLLAGRFRMPRAQLLLTTALANLAGISPTRMARRLDAYRAPSVENFRRLLDKAEVDAPPEKTQQQGELFAEFSSLPRKRK